MAKLTSKQRNAMPQSEFALPGGRYPINDENHARNALSRVSQFGSPEEKSRVRGAVHSRFPGIGHAAQGDVAAPVRMDDVDRMERLMRMFGEAEQEARRPARIVPLQQDSYGDWGRDTSAADDAHRRMQLLAEMAMRARKARGYEDGGVVTTGGQQQNTDPFPIWGRFLDMIFKGPTRTLHSAGGAPTPPPPQNQDISIVKKAAEEAGKRNEEEQAKAKAAQKPKYGGYGK